MAMNITSDEPQYGIDSVQNGVLLTLMLHRYWDAWAMSINPVCFGIILWSLI
jgi:HNH endonuclease